VWAKKRFAAKNLSVTECRTPLIILFHSDAFVCWEVNMNAILTAAVIGTAFLALAIWIEVRERRVEPGDGSYRSSGPPRS
jgi:hypothetical protein